MKAPSAVRTVAGRPSCSAAPSRSRLPSSGRVSPSAPPLGREGELEGADQGGLLGAGVEAVEAVGGLEHPGAAVHQRRVAGEQGVGRPQRDDPATQRWRDRRPGRRRRAASSTPARRPRRGRPRPHRRGGRSWPRRRGSAPPPGPARWRGRGSRRARRRGRRPARAGRPRRGRCRAWPWRRATPRARRGPGRPRPADSARWAWRRSGPGRGVVDRRPHQRMPELDRAAQRHQPGELGALADDVGDAQPLRGRRG